MSQLNKDNSGKFRLAIKPSLVWGGVFALLLAVWLLSGMFDRQPGGDEENQTVEEEAPSKKLTRVRVRTLEAVPHNVELTIRGRTEALRSVQIRAETAGRIVALPAGKGTFVQEGDVLCEIAVDARAAQMREARALLNQRKLEWDAAKRLQKQGHRSETQTAAVQARYEAAQANARRMEIELARTKIRAPYSGIFDDRRVEIGDFMQPGQVCGSVVSQNPYLVVGQVSERDVAKLNMGDSGTAKLLSGEIVEGHIRYVAAAADPATRTFKVELEVRNEAASIEDLSEGPADGAAVAAPAEPAPARIFRDGITAELFFPLGPVPAHHISPAALGLNAMGEVGVRTVDADNVVSFVKVQLISDTSTGVWVAGLPPTVTIITVGQELVIPGEEVATVKDELLVAK